MSIRTTVMYTLTCDTCGVELTGIHGARRDDEWERIPLLEETGYPSNKTLTLDICGSCKADSEKLAALGALVIAKSGSGI